MWYPNITCILNPRVLECFGFSLWCYLTDERHKEARARGAQHVLWWQGGSAETDFCSPKHYEKEQQQQQQQKDKNKKWQEWVLNRIQGAKSSRSNRSGSQRVGDTGGKHTTQTRPKKQTRYITMENTDRSAEKKSSFVVLFEKDATHRCP